MRRTIIILSAILIIAACQNTQKHEESKNDSAATQEPKPDTTAGTTKASFDINSIPVSDKELGKFPFFSFPKGVKAMNKPIEREYDRLFVPLAGVMTPIEGRVYKTYLTAESGNSDDWSLPFIEKSYDEAITAVGGVKIFDAKVTQEEVDRVKDQATYFGEEGSIDYWGLPVKVYVIRRSNGEDVYIQLSGNTASGSLQVLQKAPFKQTISMLKADEIKKQIDETGKAVLHINFDTDKATLKPDGLEAVAEIVKVLQADNTLKLAINGYTDNSGSNEHNLQLSKDRATTVLKAITSKGISASRLTSDGFGAADPIASNDTEEGKAQNRRVELLKIK